MKKTLLITLLALLGLTQTMAQEYEYVPFVREGGCFIAVKGKGFAEELEKAEKAIEVLGGETDHLVYENGAAADPGSGGPVQGEDGGASIYIMKKKATPDKYPRPAGKPSKKPIG